MIKIGIMSFAHLHAYSYAASLKALPGVELAGIWDDDAERGETAAKDYETAWHSHADALLDSGIDAVIICSENMKHRQMVEQAAAAGKWILCEKPLSPVIEDARAMIAACEKAGVGLGTAFPVRYHPTMQLARKQLQADEYGEIFAISCTNHGTYPGTWFAQPELSGGGGTMDHTVHVADVLRWMFEREFTHVYCEYGNQFHQDVFEVDDLGSMHLEMQGGMQVSHLASWSRPASFPTWGDVTMEFIGSKGVLTVESFNQKINVYSDAAMKAEWAPWGDNADMGLVGDFADAVRENRPPSITGLDGLRAVEVTVAAIESGNTHKRVAITQNPV